MSRSSNRAAIPNSDGVITFKNPRYVSPGIKPSILTNRRFTAHQSKRSSSQPSRKQTLAHKEALLLTIIANNELADPIPRRYKGGKWSAKYKRSIDCSNPKGFSQKQHCKYGRKTRKQR
jgi:hypothetical protein